MRKKFFLALFIFIGFLFFININNSFATIYTNGDYQVDVDWDTINSLIERYPDLFNYEIEDYIIFVCNGRGYAFPYNHSYFNSFSIDGNNIVFSLKNVDLPFSVWNSNDATYRYMWFNTSYANGDWNMDNRIVSAGQTYYRITDSAPHVVHSPIDIYDNNEQLVFQAAPQEGEQTILSTIATSTEFLPVMTEVLTILPILLVALISYLSLRKAIQILFQLLGNA